MVRNFRLLAGDEAGFIISAELALVLTIAVMGMAVGLTAVRDSMAIELNDVAHAFSAVSQSYKVSGLSKSRCNCGTHGSVRDWGMHGSVCDWGAHASINGFGYNDHADDCGRKPIVGNEVDGKQDPSQDSRE